MSLFVMRDTPYTHELSLFMKSMIHFLYFEALLHHENGEDIVKIIHIQSDHGREFENSNFSYFYVTKGISHEFSTPISPKKVVIVERNKCTMVEMARGIMHTKHLPYYSWAQAMNTPCHVRNRLIIQPCTKVTHYELWRGEAKC